MSIPRADLMRDRRLATIVLMSRGMIEGTHAYDVLIIGGGPVGCQVAVGLAGRGHRVAVLERKLDPGTDVCCTGIVSEECVREYSIDESLIWRHVRGARLIAPSGGELAFQRDRPQAAVLDRGAFNAAWVGRARRAGANVLLGTRVTGIVVDADSASVRTIGVGGEEGRMEARVAVIAVGASAGPAAAAGLGRCADVALGAQAEVAADGIDFVSIYNGDRVSPGFFGWLVPTRPGRALVGLLCRRHPRERLNAFVAALAGAGKVDAAGAEVRLGSVTLAPLARTYADRIIVVGTAAGQVKPVTGGGIYFGLLCADVAARTLDRALTANDLSARRLAAYQRGWKRRIGRELLAGRWARRLYERLTDGQLDKIVDIMARDRTLDAALQEPDVSFDGHGALVRYLIGNTALAKLVGVGLLRGRTKRDSW